MFPAIIDILRLAFINFFILEGFLYCIHSISLVSRPYLSGLGMGFLSDFHPLSMANSSCLNLLWVFCPFKRLCQPRSKPVFYPTIPCDILIKTWTLNILVTVSKVFLSRGNDGMEACSSFAALF